MIQFPSSLAVIDENWVAYDHDALVSCLMGQGQHYQSRRPIETLMWLEHLGKAVVVEISFQSSLIFSRKCTNSSKKWKFSRLQNARKA